MNYFKKLPENLKTFRKDYGYTQKELAEALGIKYQSYQAYERGIALPTLKHFIEIAEFYEVSLDELIGREDRN